MSDHTQNEPFGWAAFASGAAAFMLAMVIFWAGPFAPQQSAGVSLGELAAEIAKSTARAAAGQEQPAPVAPTRSVDDYLATGIAILAGLAVILGLASLVRREGRRTAMAGITLGGLAIGFQLFTWAVMMIAGVIALVGLLYALRDVLGDGLGGLFGG
ncbi:MAG: hypothetical protein GVY34_12800 [Alphaproteobacteria bacterium]|nr:hypothetical protein [Alphaproteobacteria bacterium]